MADTTGKGSSTRTLSAGGVLKSRRGPRGTQPETFVRAEVLTALGSRSDTRLFRAARANVEVVVSRIPLRTAWMEFGVDGQADLIGWVQIAGVGVHLEVETKSESGRLSQAQLWRKEMVERSGGIYIATRSATDAVSQLDYEIAQALHRIQTNI